MVEHTGRHADKRGINSADRVSAALLAVQSMFPNMPHVWRRSHQGATITLHRPLCTSAYIRSYAISSPSSSSHVPAARQRRCYSNLTELAWCLNALPERGQPAGALPSTHCGPAEKHSHLQRSTATMSYARTLADRLQDERSHALKAAHRQRQVLRALRVVHELEALPPRHHARVDEVQVPCRSRTHWRLAACMTATDS